MLINININKCVYTYRLAVFNDSTWNWGPTIPDIVYEGMDPRLCFYDIFTDEYQHINAQTLLDVAAYVQTGDTQLAVYDFEDQSIYVSYNPPNTNQPAYLT